MASTTPAGWYADPAQRHEHRFWDGSRWTEHVASHGEQDVHWLDAMPVAATPTDDQSRAVGESSGQTDPNPVRERPSQETPVEIVVASRPGPEPGPRWSAPQVSAFNAKRVAQEAIAEVRRLEDVTDRLQGVLERFGIEDVMEREARLSELQAALDSVRSETGRAQADLDAVRATLLHTRDVAEHQELGLYSYEHAADSSADLADELAKLRERIRAFNRVGNATHAATDWTVNGSKAEGRKMVNSLSRMMLRAYNAEAENCVKTVRAGNLQSAMGRLGKAVESVAKNGQMVGLRIDSSFHQLRLDELSLAARHLKAVQVEREAERERKAELREQRRVEQELAKEHERLDKEKAHYENSIAVLEGRGDAEGAERLRAELAEIDRAIEDVDYRAANIRAGYVYVISNLGAFGPEIVKIGMTRRLEPMDRVKELSDASVPFLFDVHALFFSKDAVGIEAMLHREFAAERVNKVNLRREFFRARPEEVLKVLQDQQVEVLEYTREHLADEYRTSWPELFLDDVDAQL